MSDPQTPQEDEPKLVVDNDWKEQVAREKEGTASTSESAPQGTVEEDPASAEVPSDEILQDAVTSVDEGVDSEQLPSPPPASFDVLISMLFTQALAALGQMPDPSGGEMKVNKPFAKHFIDTLEMLGEKTKGNLSDDETKMLSEALHALRMAYVNVKG